MTVSESMIKEIASVIAKVDEAALKQTARRLTEAKRIFAVGEGRSGLMAKAFAMRLMHLGAASFVIGETITPAIAPGDALVAISGSGETRHVVWTADKARAQGAFVQAISTNGDSGLAKAADALLLVPAATKFRRAGEAPSIQPLGSLFDQCAHIVFDAICLHYAALQDVGQADAFQAHSNLES